jgi:hypothetical protein
MSDFCIFITGYEYFSGEKFLILAPSGSVATTIYTCLRKSAVEAMIFQVSKSMLEWYQHLPEQINPLVFTVGFFSLYWYAVAYMVALCVAGYMLWI